MTAADRLIRFAMDGYLRAFDSPQVALALHDLIGLTGSLDQIEAVAGQYRVKYRKHPRPAGGYSMDHSADLYVIDRSGQLFAVVPYGLPPEHVLGVVQHLLDGDS